MPCNMPLFTAFTPRLHRPEHASKPAPPNARCHAFRFALHPTPRQLHCSALCTQVSAMHPDPILQLASQPNAGDFQLVEILPMQRMPISSAISH
jgi:hypothetical protein